MKITDAQGADLGPTPEPGIYSGVPFADYLAWPYLSKSALRSFEISPAQYQLELTKPFEPSDAMILGSMVDTLFFDGREALLDGYMAIDLASKRSDAWKRFAAECEDTGFVAVLQSQWDTAEVMTAALEAHHGARAARADGLSQLSLVWVDPETGLWCKGRPDLVDPDRRGVDDLKTARDITPSGFSKACTDYNYHWQGRHYLDGLETLTGEPWDGGFRLITVRSAPVHGVQIYRMKEAALELAAVELPREFKKFRRCLLTDHWPATESEGELTVDLKRWRYTR